MVMMTAVTRSYVSKIMECVQYHIYHTTDCHLRVSLLLFYDEDTNNPAKSTEMLDECLNTTIPKCLQLIQSGLVYIGQRVKK